MVKISGIDEKWHESLQILLVLKAGALNRKELCEKVAENQKRIIADYTRSKSTCIYWINSHLKDGKIREVDSLLELTKLGKWIVDSNIGTIEERELFISNDTCWKCRPTAIVLYELKTDSAEMNRKGDVFMNVECPRCSDSVERNRVSCKKVESVEEFTDFYKRAKEELRQRGILDLASLL